MARKILLADDSVTAQNMGRKILADAGYEVLTVNNGSAALKRITESKPDLIVLDVYMPGYSGLEVCQRLKDSSETAQIPVLLTVGKLEPFKPDEARRVRADGHIVKPFEASELLSALARLEDRMVPQADQPRFSSTIMGLDRFGREEDPAKTAAMRGTDMGWKSRLAFPAKRKKKEEPEAEPDDSANFRDFRKDIGKAGGSSATSAAPAPPVAQEPGLVAEIPRDITPEELDALSALAAKLDGPIPAVENVAPLAEKVGPAVEVAAAAAPTAATEEAAPAPAAEAPAGSEATAGNKEFEIAPPVEAAESGVEARTEAEIPVAQVETVSEMKAAVPPVESPAEKDTPQIPDAQALVTVDTSLLTQEPAPIDRQDEPIFAATAETPVAPLTDSCAAAQETVEALAPSDASATLEPAVAQAEESQAATPKTEEAAAEERKLDGAGTQSAGAGESKEEESRPVEAVPPVPVAAGGESPEVEAPGPSDEELAEALRLLTPASSHGDSAAPAGGTLEASAQTLSGGAVQDTLSGTRWTAEAVALTPEEAAMSLEEEMFRTFAAAPGGGLESPPVTSPVSAITAAVEARPAEPDLTACGTAGVAELVAESAPGASAQSEVSAEKEPPDAAAHETTIAAIGQDVEQNASPANVGMEAPEEKAPLATFADAMAQLEAGTFSGGPAAPERPEAPPSETTVTAASEQPAPNLEFGGPEDMAKDGKEKSTKSKGRHSHTRASAGAEDAVEATGHGALVAEEAPKAMAAAATAEGTAPSTPDANTIASIVDSVLADLRPKIVEEIAKKLAGK